MFNISEFTLDRLAIHFVGNHIQEEGVALSREEFPLHDSAVRDLLTRYFLASFKQEVYYHLQNETDLDLNDVYRYASLIFDNPENFFEQGLQIANHLYECSTHPNIKGGELYVAYFENCSIGNEVVDAVGLFKSENKDLFLMVDQQESEFEVGHQEGININKLDKGCLIINSERELGYKVVILDKINKKEDIQYWKEHFLNVKPREDNFFHTQNYMRVCHDFVKEVFNDEHNVDRTQQIDMLNRSAKFFETREAFDKEDFEKQVMLGEPEVVNAFAAYKDQYIADRNLPMFDEFDISEQAVKNNKKLFKSIIKLDKNFHLYVHGNQENIERGFDEERNMFYYKVFFKQES